MSTGVGSLFTQVRVRFTQQTKSGKVDRLLSEEETEATVLFFGLQSPISDADRLTLRAVNPVS